MPSYSKAPWGLFVFPRLTGIFTSFAISPSLLPRQFSHHYAIRAGRNLPDKEFRYLRTVIVTAAVHQGLDSNREVLLVTFWHWAGVSPYTSPCGFAETCVFGKQLHEIFSCGPDKSGQGLSRSYTCCIAEFLSSSYLDHLGLLDLPTGVGLRYANLLFSLPRFFLSAEISGIVPTKSEQFASLLANYKGFTASSINL